MAAKIGFTAWEGDSNLAVNETLRVNGNIISNPPLNPEENAFNGTNSFTGSSQLYNMDLDFYYGMKLDYGMPILYNDILVSNSSTSASGSEGR